MVEIMKACINCSKFKALNDFNASKRTKDGRTTLCKACRNAKEAVSRDKVKERCRYHANKHRHKESRKLHYKKNAEKYLAKSKVWREKNPEKLSEMRKRYAKKRVNVAKDGYIKHLLKSGTSLHPSEIPLPLMECKPLQLMI